MYLGYDYNFITREGIISTTMWKENNRELFTKINGY
jgi:hypothetical protein